MEYIIGLVCGGMGMFVVMAVSVERANKAKNAACQAWADAHAKAEKGRGDALARVKALEKNATDLADALERANARAEVAEAARLAAVDEAAVLRQRLVHIRALVGSESRPSVPNR